MCCQVCLINLFSLLRKEQIQIELAEELLLFAIGTAVSCSKQMLHMLCPSRRDVRSKRKKKAKKWRSEWEKKLSKWGRCFDKLRFWYYHLWYVYIYLFVILVWSNYPTPSTWWLVGKRWKMSRAVQSKWWTMVKFRCSVRLKTKGVSSKQRCLSRDQWGGTLTSGHVETEIKVPTYFGCICLSFPEMALLVNSQQIPQILYSNPFFVLFYAVNFSLARRCMSLKAVICPSNPIPRWDVCLIFAEIGFVCIFWCHRGRNTFSLNWQRSESSWMRPKSGIRMMSTPLQMRKGGEGVTRCQDQMSLVGREYKDIAKVTAGVATEGFGIFWRERHQKTFAGRCISNQSETGAKGGRNKYHRHP